MKTELNSEVEMEVQQKMSEVPDEIITGHSGTRHVNHVSRSQCSANSSIFANNSGIVRE